MMKRIIMLLLFAYIALNNVVGQEKGIYFEKGLNWEKLKSKARVTNKLIFVDFYTTWCGPCKAMDANVYSNELVGTAFNEKFISVKIQMDSTAKDNDEIRSWYPMVKYFQDRFQIFAFPSFMFFTPDGAPLHRSLGFKDYKAFIALGEAASNPRKQYYTLLNAYRSGKKDYLAMGELASQARSFGDKAFAEQIAKDYKDNYLNKISPQELLTRGNINFLMSHINLISSSDYFFQLCYKTPVLLDTINSGLADIIIKSVIENEEIKPYIKKGDQFLKKEPNWADIKKNITRKYNKLYADTLVLEARLEYYKRMGMWKQFANWRNKKILLYPPRPTGGPGGDMTSLNSDAWAVFTSCNDRIILQQALSWSDIIVTKGSKIDIITSCMDTRANLLYKLGHRQEAIKYEAEVVALEERSNKGPLPEDNSIMKNYRKMVRGEPTWKD